MPHSTEPSCLQHWSLRLYLHRFGAGSHFELGVDARRVVGPELDAIADISLEPSRLDRHAVNTRTEIGHIVIAVLVGYSLEVKVGFRVYDGHLRGGNNRPAAIRDVPYDGCGASGLR